MTNLSPQEEQYQLMQMYKDRKVALRHLLIKEGCSPGEVMNLTLGQLVDLKWNMGLED